MKKQIGNLNCLICPKNKQVRLWTGLCQACYKMKMRYNSPKFRLCTIYQAIKNRCTNKKDKYYYGMQYCTRDEFLSKFINDPAFLEQFKNWKLSGHKMTQVPSVDRIDVNKGYHINNIQFIIHSENCWKDRRTIPVMVISNEEIIGIYPSLNQAVVKLNVHQSNAWKVLIGEREHTNGYIFERLEDE